MRLHRRQGVRQAAGVERPHLLERALRQHGLEPALDPALQFVALRMQENLDRAIRIDDRRQSLAVPVGDRPAGRLQHFQRPQNSRAVARHDPAGGDRIARAKFGMQGLDALRLQPRPQGRADRGIDRRDRGKPAHQRLEIEPGAAGKDRAPHPAATRASVRAASAT